MSNAQAVRRLTCGARQLFAGHGLASADWVNRDRVCSDPGVIDLERHQCVGPQYTQLSKVDLTVPQEKMGSRIQLLTCE